MNMASFSASLPGTRLENPTASTNCASVISLPTRDLPPRGRVPDGIVSVVWHAAVYAHSAQIALDAFGATLSKRLCEINWVDLP